MRILILFASLFFMSSSWAQVVISSAQTTPEVVTNGDPVTVTETGSVIVTADTAIEFTTTDVTGDIQVDGTVETSSSSGFDHAITLTDVGVAGSIIINGNVTAATDDAIDIMASQKTITGSIINNGTIQGGNGELNVSALEAELVVIEGDIINSATGIIIALGDNGIKFDGDVDSDFTDNEGVLEGQLINHGTITANCEGLDIDGNAWIKSGIVNTGTIQSLSDGCYAIEIDETSRVDGGITNSGLIKSPGNAIYLSDNSIVTGDIVNDDRIESDNNGIKFLGDSLMTGNIVNNKTIQAGDDGIDIEDSRLEGSIINALDASITSTGSDGIKVDSGSQVTGQLINRGTISSTGGEALDLDGTIDIDGGIINSGTLKATDDEAIEIDEETEIDGGFDNSGLIESDEDVIHLEYGSILNGGLTNSGRIRSNSTTSGNGFELRDATLNGGLTNTGLIAAPNNALSFESDATMTGSLDNQSGGVIIGLITIETSVNMINGGQWFMKANANFNDPTNTGSVGALSTLIGTYAQTSSGLLGIASEALGFSQLTVDGDVTFASGATLEVDVKNGGQHLALGDLLENVVQASGSLTAQRLQIIDNSPEFDFVAEIDNQNLSLRVVEQALQVPSMSTFGLVLLMLLMIAMTTVSFMGTRSN